MKDRSVKTRRGCFNLLAEIVHVAPGALANHVQVILPGIQYSLAGTATASSCFFSYFLKKNLGGKIDNPLTGKDFVLSFLLAMPLSPSQRPLNVFLFWHSTPTRAPSPHALLPKLQLYYEDTVRCVAIGAEVPGHHPKQSTQTLIFLLQKNPHFHTDPWLIKASRTELS